MIVVGTRPEIIKMAPVVRALEKHGQPLLFVHTGQHYNFSLSSQFIMDLELPKPTYNLKVHEESPATQTGKIMIRTERLIKIEKPKLTLIEGDTNSVLATGLASLKQHVPIAHVESGPRSYDFKMPEEHNRRIVDHISHHLFAPSEKAKTNLLREHVLGDIYVTGNTVIDAVLQHIPLAEKTSEIMKYIKFKEYALATAHRMENVDNPKVLKNFVEAFIKSPIPIVYPLHPRTKKRLHQHKLWRTLSSSKNVQILSPLGYFDFLALMKNCRLIITDSGGIQQEATAPPLRKPVVVIRLSTGSPEAVEAGFARVVGTETGKILLAVNEILNEKLELPTKSPFGDGNAGSKIAQICMEKLK